MLRLGGNGNQNPASDGVIFKTSPLIPLSQIFIRAASPLWHDARSLWWRSHCPSRCGSCTPQGARSIGALYSWGAHGRSSNPPWRCWRRRPAGGNGPAGWGSPRSAPSSFLRGLTSRRSSPCSCRYTAHRGKWGSPHRTVSLIVIMWSEEVKILMYCYL